MEVRAANPFAAALDARRASIAAAAAEAAEWDDGAATLTALAGQLSAAVELGQPIQAQQVREALSDRRAGRALRALSMAAIDALQPLAGEPGYKETVLAIRSAFHGVMPPVDVAPEKFRFYEQFMEASASGLPDEAQPAIDLFRTVMSTLGEMVYVHDLQGNFLYVNKRGMSLTGYTRDDLYQGMNIYDIVAPESLHVAEQRLMALRSGSWSPSPVTIYTKQGVRIPLEVSTRPLIEQGRLEAVVGIARDIRLERRLEEEVHRARTYMESIFDNAPIGCVLTDTTGVVSAMNPEACRLFGLDSSKEAIGRNLADLAKPDDACFASLRVAIKQAEEFHQECQSHTANGMVLNCEIAAVPRRIAGGPVEGAIVLLDDLSHEIALRHKLVQSEKLSALGKIVAGVSHELNNPLTGIIGFTQLVLADDIPPSIRTRVDQIGQEASRCQRIVQNLLSFARKHESSMKSEDINRIVLETLALREYQLSVDGIEVITSLANDLPTVTCDTHAIQSVLLNIITNAQQALGVRCNGPKKRIEISTATGGGYVRVRIADNGPGISEEHKTHVFDPFFTTKEPGHGTGLGLSVSYGIVEDHGGQIAVHSEPKRGATFDILLPADTES